MWQLGHEKSARVVGRAHDLVQEAGAARPKGFQGVRREPHVRQHDLDVPSRTAEKDVARFQVEVVSARSVQADRQPGLPGLAMPRPGSVCHLQGTCHW